MQKLEANGTRLWLDPGRALLFLLVMLVFFVAGHALAGYFEFVLGHEVLPLTEAFYRLFSIGKEMNFATWWSSLNLLAASVLLALIGLAVRRAGRPYARHWLALSLIFLAMSIDETAALHEELISPLRKLLGTGGFLYFAWVIPGALFALAVFLCYLGFLRAAEAPLRRGMLISGALFVGGALGAEALGGKLAEAGLRETGRYHMVTGIEEAGELLGLALFIYTLLRHMQHDPAAYALRLEASGGAREKA